MRISDWSSDVCSSDLVAAAAPAKEPGGNSSWAPRGEDYPNTKTLTDLAIPMSDGTVLRGDLVVPADADGNANDKKFPVIVTITAYKIGRASCRERVCQYV